MLLIVLLLLALGSITSSVAFAILPYDHLWPHEALHASLEVFGGMAAIAMAMLLLQMHRDGLREQNEYYLLSMGFFMMGILDAFHAITTFGFGFILLRSLSSLLSGCWFALVWSRPLAGYLARNRKIPWLVIVLCLAIGFLIIKYRSLFPLMMKDGRFTPTAFAINLLSGMLTLSAAWYFLLEFLKLNKMESFFFTCMLLLLSLSAMEFPFSQAWSIDWWLWHVQRCVAYVVVLAYISRVFLRYREDLKTANRLLEDRIAARTADLTREVAERKRYGRERDQVIAELQEALAQIKMLTGLLPTCASCRKIKDEDGKWIQMESYIQKHSEARFSHGICPACAKKLYPELYDKLYKNS